MCLQANNYTPFLSYACDPKLDLSVAQVHDVKAIARK